MCMRHEASDGSTNELALGQCYWGFVLRLLMTCIVKGGVDALPVRWQMQTVCVH